MRRSVFGILAFVVAAPFACATAVTFNNVVVDGSDQIYTAENNSGGGQSAVLAATFGTASNNYLTITATGSVKCSDYAASNGPDGGCGGSALLSSVNKLSGIQATGDNMFLAGVFLANSLPSKAPASLSYPNAASYDQASYGPLQLGQVFFIGDGLTGTGSGTQQTFLAPEGATRLYLGFVEASNGSLAHYCDDTGKVIVSGSIGGTATPEPATMAMIGMGLTLVAWRRKK